MGLFNRKTRKDARESNTFVDPTSGNEVSFAYSYLWMNNSSRLRDLARKGYGKKIVGNVVEKAFRGWFTSDKVSDDKLRELFKKCWMEWKQMVKYQREQGLGILLVMDEKETLADLDNNVAEFLYFNADTLKVVAVDPLACYPVVPDPWATGIREVSEYWMYGHFRVHVSRMAFFQVQRKEFTFTGIGEIEPIQVPLMLLRMLGEGGLKRADAWKVMKLIAKLGTSGIPTSGVTFNRIRDHFGQENMEMMSNGDAIQFLSQPGIGEELKNLAIDEVSSSTDIPKLALTGTSHGKTTGAEVDMTLWGDVIETVHSQFTLGFLLDFGERFLNIDFGEVDWNVNFFTSRQQQIELEMMEIKLEEMKKNPGMLIAMPFGGGIDNKKEEGKAMLQE